MKIKINTEIALTHILTRKRQTIVAALGVTIGIAFFIFSNSMMSGFNKYSKKEMFKIISHITVFKEDEKSKPLFSDPDNKLVIISNPKIINQTKKIINPFALLDVIKNQSYVTNSVGKVDVDIFYHNGKSQLKGIGSGFSDIKEANEMFNINSTTLIGSLENLESDIDAIIIGKGVAEKMNVDVNDYLTISSSFGVSKVMRIAGIFSIGNKNTDNSKCYMNIKTAQMLLKENPYFINEILVNVDNPELSIKYAKEIQKLTEYKVEDWQISNADTLAGDRMRDTMAIAVPGAILLVAAFGIYNILNMTITQKLNDIAILKATGFSGSDVIKIFVSEAVCMGVIGVILGLGFGAILLSILQNVYVGKPVGNFPVYFQLSTFIMGGIFGMLVTVGAGYFPAKRAAKVDPITIFRSL